MLSATGSHPPVRPRRPTGAAVAAAVVPTARVARLGPGLLTVALGAVPAVVIVARGFPVEAVPVFVVALAAGASLGWAVDEPPSELLTPLPISSPTRLAMRIVCVAVVAAPTALGLLLLVTGARMPAGWLDRVPEATAAGALALAVGLVAARRGERAASPVAVTAGALGVLVVGALAFRWPAVFPAVGGGPVHTRWWLVAAAGVAVAVRAGRDAGRR